LKLGKWFNKFTYQLIHKGYRAYDKVVNDFRQVTLGLDKLPKNASPLHMTNGEPIPVLHAYSEHVWPRPLDWPETAHITGYWFLDNLEQWQPPVELADFLENGEPPVYVGFGSMAGRDPQRMAEIVIAALQKAGARGIIATGWGGLDASNLPENIFKIESVPHEWLFPRVTAAVHHGGAGTTAAGLRAGRPTIVCPFLVDQPYWGARVHALGVGSQPIPQKKLNAENLSEAITEVLNSASIREKAQALGEQLRAEDGVGQAVRLLEQIGRR
jgi:sterol 3beta-glucosyltransferase